MNSRIVRCILAFSLLASVFVLLVERPVTVRADAAPFEPPEGANPKPGLVTTQVRMLAETVLLDVDANTPSSEALAHVTASFTLRNLGEQTETMDVGFPLDQTTGWFNLCQGMLDFNPIADLAAWVNGTQVQTKKYYVENAFPPDYASRMIPCVEYFPVTFPPDEDVTIKVTYTGEPYHGKHSYEYGYLYVLETGAGWFGTIGSADITVRLPYELDLYNYIDCWPKPCTVSRYEVQWHFEDFEPDRDSNIWAAFLPPPLWQRILTERANTARNSEDGETWGRLGKAYKEAIIDQKRYSFRFDEPGTQMYRWSDDAYQKALALLPDDPEWHYGYAELLCHRAGWSDRVDQDDNVALWQACTMHLKQALKLRPDYPQVSEFLQLLTEYYGVIVKWNSSQPDYLILTPPSAATSAPVSTKTPSRAASPTSVVSLPGLTPTLLPSVLPVISQTAVAQAMQPTLAPTTALPAGLPGASGKPVYFGMAILLAFVVLIVIIVSRRR